MKAAVDRMIAAEIPYVSKTFTMRYYNILKYSNFIDT